MPLKWERGVNPYVFSYFGKVRSGPNSTPAQIQARATALINRLSAGESVALADRPLDEFAISEAAKGLLEPGVQAEELLLVHPQRRDERANLDRVVTQVTQAAALADERQMPALVCAGAIFWFVPAPDGDSARLPAFEALGLVTPGDEKDLQLDVVFDE